MVQLNSHLKQICKGVVISKCILLHKEFIKWYIDDIKAESTMYVIDGPSFCIPIELRWALILSMVPASSADMKFIFVLFLPDNRAK